MQLTRAGKIKTVAIKTVSPEPSAPPGHPDPMTRSLQRLSSALAGLHPSTAGRIPFANSQSAQVPHFVAEREKSDCAFRVSYKFGACSRLRYFLNCPNRSGRVCDGFASLYLSEPQEVSPGGKKTVSDQ